MEVESYYGVSQDSARAGQLAAYTFFMKCLSTCDKQHFLSPPIQAWLKTFHEGVERVLAEGKITSFTTGWVETLHVNIYWGIFPNCLEQYRKILDQQKSLVN